MLQRYHGADRAASFDLLPAIDLRGGRVVRLRAGDFGRETRYSDAPASIAEAFVAAGATWLHVVDLDGARSGRPVQVDAVCAVLDAVAGRARVEVAGGVRDAAAVAAGLEAGAARVVVGTAALRDTAFAAALIASHGVGAVAVALDVRGGLVVGEGWRAGAEGEPVERVLARLADVGVRTFEVTAIERDGGLDGPDLDLLGRLVALDRGDIVASAGIASVDDLLAVRSIGCSGAIVGRALYEGRLAIPDALAALEGHQPAGSAEP